MEYISANICYFYGIVSRSGQASPKIMKNHWKINNLVVTSVTTRSLIKPYENEHFRWSVSGETGPCSDCSRCRCARHWAPWATKCGNTHFHCNALVAPSWQLRRPTGQHAHKCDHLSMKIAKTGRYEPPWFSPGDFQFRMQAQSRMMSTACIGSSARHKIPRSTGSSSRHGWCRFQCCQHVVLSIRCSA